MTCKRSTVPTLLVHPALKSVLKGLMAANNGGSPISVLGVGTPRGHNLTTSYADIRPSLKRMNLIG